MLGAGVVLVFIHGQWSPRGPWPPFAAGVGTIALVVLYNWWHKSNPFGPAIMGLCRVGLYMVAALSVSSTLPPSVFIGGGLLLSYVLGLTYVAKHENQSALGRSWPLLCLFAPLLYGMPLLLGPLWARSLLGGFVLWVMRSRDHVKQGNPKAIRTAVVSLIAGIALVDGMLVARFGNLTLALGCVAAFGATLALQRRIAGT
jgi:4-hydroxybenzoate polyprenyltransferase